jgi:hypothetical protein
MTRIYCLMTWSLSCRLLHSCCLIGPISIHPIQQSPMCLFQSRGLPHPFVSAGSCICCIIFIPKHIGTHHQRYFEAYDLLDSIMLVCWALSRNSRRYEDGVYCIATVIGICVVCVRPYFRLQKLGESCV